MNYFILLSFDFHSDQKYCGLQLIGKSSHNWVFSSSLDIQILYFSLLYLGSSSNQNLELPDFQNGFIFRYFINLLLY